MTALDEWSIVLPSQACRTVLFGAALILECCMQANGDSGAGKKQLPALLRARLAAKGIIKVRTHPHMQHPAIVEEEGEEELEGYKLWPANKSDCSWQSLSNPAKRHSSVSN